MVCLYRRYDHHSYQSSHASDDVRSKDLRHRYPDIPSKSSSSKGTSPSLVTTQSLRCVFYRLSQVYLNVSRVIFAESGRYDRNAPSEGWSRSTSGMSSAVKSFSGGISGSGSTSMSSRDAWAPSSSDRKSEAQPPWARTGGSSSDRYVKRYCY